MRADVCSWVPPRNGGVKRRLTTWPYQRAVAMIFNTVSPQVSSDSLRSSHCCDAQAIGYAGHYLHQKGAAFKYVVKLVLKTMLKF